MASGILGMNSVIHATDSMLLKRYARYMNRIEKAFQEIKRRDFLPEYVQDRASGDVALPIGYGQTNSQPTTVRRMLEWLDAQPGQKVLDVGSGSGWTSALLSRIVGTTGHVDAVEIIPDLVAFGRDNCGRLGLKNISFHQAGIVYGLPDKAPFDRILVSASAEVFPDDLLEQLATPGKMVVPVVNTIYEVERFKNGTTEVFAHAGYLFVPLVNGS